MMRPIGRERDGGFDTTGVDARVLFRIGVIMSLGYFVVETLSETYLADLSVIVRAGVKLVGMLSLWMIVIRPLQRASQRATRATELERQVGRGLDMVQTEDDCYRLAATVFETIAPGEQIELLLTDSSEAHLRQVLPGRSEDPACGVRAPADCPAVQGAQPIAFGNVGAIDLCPHLRSLDHPVTAVCMPITMLGHASGVVHHHDVGASIDSRLLESTARLVGARLSMIRALTSSALQAATDPLTGLLNRRSLEQQAEAILAARTETTVALIDLDRFKRLNDTHGHAAGDRALASFARLVQGAVRTTDLVSRYGGEEFVLVLPQQSLDEAERFFDRLRDDLLALNERTGLPPFTFSAGIAHTSSSRSFTELVALADRALMRAKTQGRDQIVRSGEDTTIQFPLTPVSN